MAPQHLCIASAAALLLLTSARQAAAGGTPAAAAARQGGLGAASLSDGSQCTASLGGAGTAAGECGITPRTAVCPNLGEGVDSAEHGGWVPPVQGSTLDTDICTIERRHMSDITPEEFLSDYWESRPLIIEGYRENIDSPFAGLCSRADLLSRYGTLPIVLSSANKNSYEKRTVSLDEYLKDFMGTPPVTQLGNTTWYHFGNNDHRAWPELFACYERPTRYMHHPDHYAYSFGIGASGTGVPFHTHGGVFNEVLYGRKRWWLQEPGPEPPFHPDESALQWTFTYYNRTGGGGGSSGAAGGGSGGGGLLECVIEPGEFIYVPGAWHHSTLNIGDTVFMATFL